jgi:hypothetical protein
MQRRCAAHTPRQQPAARQQARRVPPARQAARKPAQAACAGPQGASPAAAGLIHDASCGPAAHLELVQLLHLGGRHARVLGVALADQRLGPGEAARRGRPVEPGTLNSAWPKRGARRSPPARSRGAHRWKVVLKRFFSTFFFIVPLATALAAALALSSGSASGVKRVRGSARRANKQRPRTLGGRHSGGANEKGRVPRQSRYTIAFASLQRAPRSVSPGGWAARWAAPPRTGSTTRSTRPASTRPRGSGTSSVRRRVRAAAPLCAYACRV